MYSLCRMVTSSTLRRGALVAGKEARSDNAILDARVVQHVFKNSEVQRDYSNRKGFLENFIETIKQEYNKDPELKESIKKFRQEAKELEDSDALKQARKKFQEIEKETTQSTEVLQETFGKIKSKVSETAEELGSSEVGKAASRISGGISDAAKRASESEALKKVQSRLSDIAQGSGVAPDSLYRPPTVLRMRKQELSVDPDREYQPNTEATNIVMHKDTIWNQQWESFKTSKVGESISEMKMRFDESDNVLIRGSRFITDKISGVAGSLFGGTDISKVMTEIARIDPEFSAQGFLDFCRFEIIPNLLEAISQGNENIVKDWCSEADQIMKVFHVWALCRDVEEMDRRAAWKIIDQSMSASPMLL